MVMVTQYPVPVPEHDEGTRPGGTGKAKTVRKGGSLPPVAKVTGAGQGRIRTGWSGSKSQGGSLPGNPRRS